MAIAYGVSWSWWLLAWLGGGQVPFLAGVMGPAVAAVVVLRLTGGSLRDWGRSLVRWRVPFRWWGYALGLPALLYMAVSGVLHLLGEPVEWSLVVERAPAYAATWLFVLVLGGALEEPGWRGYGLPHLLERHSPIGATLIIGLVWGFWHVPIYGPLGFVVPTLLAFFYTYLWARTGSVLLCVLLHASFTPAQDHLILLPRDVAYTRALDTPDLVILGVYVAAVAVLLLATRGRLGVPRASRTDSPVALLPRRTMHTRRGPHIRLGPPARHAVLPLLPLLIVLAAAPAGTPADLPGTDSHPPVPASAPASAAASDPASPSARADRAADVLAEHLAAAGIPGGAVTVVDRDGHVESRGVGVTAAGDAVTGTTSFVIGSAGKSFTALAVMQLVEDGRVALTDPVTDFVPELELDVGEPVDQITVQHLLQHTSGLDDLAGGQLLASAQDGTALEAVHELAGARLVSAPGERWRYANANYVLAGLVVERASGRPYADHLRERVLDPLGMDQTYVGPSPVVQSGHRYWFGAVVADGPVQRDSVMAAGYLASSAEDLGSYLALFLRDGTSADGARLVSADSVRTLTAPGPESHLGVWAGDAQARYAMGWMVGGPWRERTVFHPGNSPDSSAMIALFPDQGLGVAVLVPAGHELPVPGNPSLTDRISRATVHAAVGEESPPPTSRWSFYLWFDLVVLALATLLLWRLVVALRVLDAGTPAGGAFGSRARSWLRAVPPLVLTGLLLLVPVVAAAGWAAVWTWAPDLGVTLLGLAAITAATAAVRLLTAVRASQARQNSLPSGSAIWMKPVSIPSGSKRRTRVAPSATSRSEAASSAAIRSSPASPGATRRSRWTRFLAVLPSGTFWK